MKNFEEKGAKIYDGATIEDNCIIDYGAIIYPGAIIKENTYIGPYCIIGEHTMDFYKDSKEHKYLPTVIGPNSIIRSNTVIYENVNIGENFQTGHHVTIREKSVIGKNCSVGTLSDLQGNLRLGDFVRLHSNVFLAPNTEIEDYVWLLPHVIITNDMYPPHDKVRGVTIKKFAIVTAGVTVLPGVTIGENSFVAARATVTKDVNPFTIAIGNPAIEKGDIRNLKDKDGIALYPWPENLEDYRGYPWQEKKRELNK